MLLEEVRHPLSQVIVVGHVSEVVQSEVTHTGLISLWKTNHLRGAEVLELFVMCSRHKLETVPYQVSIHSH